MNDRATRWFTPILERETARRKRYISKVSKLSAAQQAMVILRSDVSVGTGSLVKAEHGQPETFTWLRPAALTFVRLEWMIQDKPSRPCIGWRIWLYTAWRAFHFDLVLRLGRA